MMLSDGKPVFIQIKTWIENRILSGEWSAGTQLPSVRELSLQFSVNANTIVRTYERLVFEETVYSVRGVGYFVGETAGDLIRVRRREEFYRKELPDFVAAARVLGVEIGEFVEYYQKTVENEKDK